MKKILLVFILIFTMNWAFPYDYAKEGFPPILSSASFGKLSQAEQMILGQTYENQHISVRLDRLEQTVFNRTYPKLNFEQRINNIVVNYRNNSSFSGLSKLEERIFSENFSNEPAERRISRLEEKVFGTIQSGNLHNRYRNLQKAGTSYANNRLIKQYGTPVIRTGGGWRGLAGSLGNFFNGFGNGYPTGYTPQIYSPYNNFPTPAFQQFNNSNHGWGYNGTDYGSGTTVHILD